MSVLRGVKNYPQIGQQLLVNKITVKKIIKRFKSTRSVQDGEYKKVHEKPLNDMTEKFSSLTSIILRLQEHEC